MRAKPRSKFTLLFMTFAMLLAFSAVAFAQDAPTETDPSGTTTQEATTGADTSAPAAPTIQSDKADYPPGGTVILTGQNWQPGESVHIYVNDDLGKTWEGNFYVVADDNGDIRQEFQLPDWFVATYSVKATGAQSGEATTSFTDAIQVKLQGKSNPACAGTGGNCDGGFEGGPLSGWKELDKVPMRLKFPDMGTYPVVVSFKHASTSGHRIPGVHNLVDWEPVAGSGVTLNGTPQLDNSDAAIWKYRVDVTVTKKGALLNFNAKLAAGSHAFPGGSLAVDADQGGGTVQIKEPLKGPGSPDLLVTKSGPENAAPGATITYRLSYENKSTAANQATGVELTDVLPGGVTYVANSCSNGCTVQGNEVIWNLGTLAKGQTGSQTLQVQVPAGAASGTTYTNNAQILSAEDDATYNDNYSSLTTTVGKVNGSPNAVNDTLTTDEETAGSINVLANDTDPDGDTLTVTANTSPQNGSVVRNGGSFTYTPNKDFHGTDSFTYTVSDGKGGEATGTVNVTVNAVNDAPVAKDDTATTPEDTPVPINVLANDSTGAANETGQKLAVKEIVNAPANGTAQIITAEGDPRKGWILYTPNKDYNGTDTFTYKVCDDGNQQACSIEKATVTVTVAPVNDPPVAVDDSYGVDEDGTLAVTAGGDPAGVLKNDTDGDNPAADLKVADANPGNAAGTIDPVAGPAHGTLTLQADGSFTYTPNNDFAGTDTFTYKANDGNLDSKDAATVTITVNPVNDAPVAKDDAAETEEDKAVIIDVLNNTEGKDSDVDGDSLSVSGGDDLTRPSNGTAELITSGEDEGKVRYTPAGNFNGTDTFTYMATDGKLKSNAATVTITVNAVNDAPSFTKGEDHTVNEDADPQTVTGWASAISAGPNESGQNVSFVVTNDNNSLFSAQPAVASDGTLTYKPDADKNGSAIVTVKIQDDGGTPNNANDDLASGEQTFTIKVNSVNDAPSFKIGADQTVDEDAGAQTVTEFATEIFKGPADESGQSVSFIRTDNTNAALFSAQPEISADGTLTYKPADNANGEAKVSFKIKDGGGTENGGKDESAAQTFTIKVTPVNDAPIVSNNQTSSQNVQYSDPIAAVTINATDVDTAASSLEASSQFKVGTGSIQQGLPSGLSLEKTAAGTWKLSGTANVAPGTYFVRVMVSDGDNTGYTDVTIVVKEEDARAEYTGSMFVSTSGSSTSKATVNLAATIRDITAVTGDPAHDPNGGDITKANIEFVLTNTSGAQVANCKPQSIALTSASDTKTGTATCSVSVDIGTQDSVPYTVVIKVGGQNVDGQPLGGNYVGTGQGVVTVSKPLPGMITGGGYLLNSRSFGQYAGDAGKRTNFGFNVKWNKSGTALQGNINTIVRKGAKIYQIKGNSMTSLVANATSTPKTATFEGKANIQDVTDPLNPVPVLGNNLLRVTMTDKGEPGSYDQIGIQLKKADGALLFSSNWSGTNTIEQVLAGGNLVVHKK